MENITQNDFEKFKLEIQNELRKGTEKLEAKIDKHLKDIKYWGIGGVILFCVLFSWIYEYKFNFTNDQHQANFDKLNAAVFVSSQEAILKAIQDLQNQIRHSDSQKIKKTVKRKTK